ncbi:hypothetical protein ID866_6042 [Astraeus odoratus]|nr:hypothetical protein ID866_6042 [Astraeus odoratus]
MLEFDQWDGLSVDNNSTSHPVNDGDDASVIALASDAGQRRPHPHPLRRPYLPIPLNTDFRSSGPSEFGETFEVGETRPRLAHLLNRSSLNDGESITADDSDTGSAEDEEDEATPIVHKASVTLVMSYRFADHPTLSRLAPQILYQESLYVMGSPLLYSVGRINCGHLIQSTFVPS